MSLRKHADSPFWHLALLNSRTPLSRQHSAGLAYPRRAGKIADVGQKTVNLPPPDGVHGPNSRREQDVSTVGDLIRSARDSRGWKQYELANYLKLRTESVSRWENGSLMPDDALIEALCEALFLDPVVVFRLKYDHKPLGKYLRVPGDIGTGPANVFATGVAKKIQELFAEHDVPQQVQMRCYERCRTEVDAWRIREQETGKRRDSGIIHRGV